MHIKYIYYIKREEISENKLIIIKTIQFIHNLRITAFNNL